MRRPLFDAVTGVSTGALIAPFAFVGDEESLDKLLHLYCNPKPDWVLIQTTRTLISTETARRFYLSAGFTEDGPPTLQVRDTG
jgi:hypothetical protein